MPLTPLNDVHVKSDSFIDNFELHRDAEASALFGKQPHFAQGENPVSTFPQHPSNRPTSWPHRVFKNPASVPDITLTCAQSEAYDTPFEGFSSLSPVFSELPSPYSTDSHCYTPSASSTPAFIAPEMSPITYQYQTPDQRLSAFDSFFSHLLSPLQTGPLSFPELSWDVSPTSFYDELPHNQLFPHPQSPEPPSFEASPSQVQNEFVFSVEPVEFKAPLPSPKPVEAVADGLMDNEDGVQTKRQRCTPPSSALAPPSVLPRHRTQSTKKTAKDRKPFATKRAASRGIASKTEFELSPEMWLRLSPPSPTSSTSSASHPPPSPSLSPSASPELENTRKRKRQLPSLPSTPSLSPSLEELSLTDTLMPPIVDTRHTALDMPSEGSDHQYAHDFLTETALSRRRSDRSRPPISYAGCDVDGDDKESKGKIKQTKRGTTATGRTPKTRSDKKNRCKLECPFTIICSQVFGRSSDVVRHLETNNLHTDTTSLWQCPICKKFLSRLDALNRHTGSRACGKRSRTERATQVCSAEVERELETIRRSRHPAIVKAKLRIGMKHRS